MGTKGWHSVVGPVALLLTALCAPACDDILPVETTDRCGDTPELDECPQCETEPFAAECPRCQGDDPDPGCENAPGDGSGGEGGTATGDAGDGDGDGGADAGSDSTMDSAVPDPPVMCNGEADCTVEPRLLCGSSGTCVQCTEDAPCSGDEVCDETGSCVECVEDEQCEDDVLLPACRTDRKQCVACTDDRHCTTPARNWCGEENECVECLIDEHCTEPGALYCLNNRCEQCRTSEHCTDPTAARCDHGNCAACDADAQCTGVERDDDAAEVCDEGECWECTGTKYDACGVDASDNDRPFVCDSRARECSQEKERGAGACVSCISDAHCLVGQFCVEQVFGAPEESVGWFCHWDRFSDAPDAPGGACGAVRPFVATLVDASTIDGQTATVCRLDETTCAAFNDIDAECESLSAPDTPDPSRCGFTHSDEDYETHEDQDGYCVDKDPTSAFDYRCTTPCSNNDEDCKVGKTCDLAPEPDLCTL